MKTVTTAFLAILLAGLVAPAQAQDIFVVNSVVNCGGHTSGISRTLPAGTHTFTLSGAVSYWSSNGQNGGNTWASFVTIYNPLTATATYYSGGFWFPTHAAASASTAGTIFSFELTAEATVWFYFGTGGPCSDDRGAVTVTLNDFIVSTEESVWGAVKTLYR